MANRVVHFEIGADDMDRAKKFYEDAFGWDFKTWEGEEDEGMNYQLIMTGPKDEPGIDGGLMLRSENPKTGGEKAYFCTIDVDDIDEAIEKVKQAGGKIITEKMEMEGVGWFAAAEDTEGNKFGLMESTGEMEEM